MWKRSWLLLVSPSPTDPLHVDRGVCAQARLRSGDLESDITGKNVVSHFGHREDEVVDFTCESMRRLDTVNTGVVFSCCGRCSCRLVVQLVSENDERAGFSAHSKST